MTSVSGGSYSDDSKGVCFGLSIKKLEMSGLVKNLPVSPNSLRFPINYNEAKLRGHVTKYVKIGVELLERVNLSARASYLERFGDALLYERDFFRILNDGFFVHSLLSSIPPIVMNENTGYSSAAYEAPSSEIPITASEKKTVRLSAI